MSNKSGAINIIDSHCHLDFEQFEADRDRVLQAANEVGVKAFINPSTDMDSSHRVLALAQKTANIYAAVGFHPYDAPALTPTALAEVKHLAQQPKVVAIGEIGLDYYRDITPKKDQIRAFERQLTLAKDLDLPVIIHQRSAAEDTLSILRQWAASGNHPGLVLHAFSGDRAMVDEALSLGFYMGIGGPITFKNTKGLPDVVAYIPLDRLLLETDAPFLSPHPYRGKRNEPARLSLIAEKLAQIFAVDCATLTSHTTQNTKKLFKLEEVL